MRKFVKKIVIRIQKILAAVLPVKNCIVFESTPDMADNTVAVFDEMLSRKLNEKYKLIWWVSDQSKPWPTYPNTVYMDTNTLPRRLRFMWYSMRAKCNICCNKFLISYSKKQMSFYLTHGTPIKSVRSYYTVPKDVDCMIVASEGTKDLTSYEANFDVEKSVALGFPRNDVLLTAKLDLHSFFDGSFSKIAVWYPTFRQHKNGSKLTNSKHSLPIIHDESVAKRLNEVAKENGVLIVLKPHFAQDVSCITESNLSNIRIINDQFFLDRGITSYQFVGSCDSLISDYSSIYFDYLLCDKPIALVWEDLEEYKENPGLAVDETIYLDASHKIYTAEDFEKYIFNLARGVDEYREARAKLNAWANYSATPDNAKRVVDFIIEKAKL